MRAGSAPELEGIQLLANTRPWTRDPHTQTHKVRVTNLQFAPQGASQENQGPSLRTRGLQQGPRETTGITAAALNTVYLGEGGRGPDRPHTPVPTHPIMQFSDLSCGRLLYLTRRRYSTQLRVSRDCTHTRVACSHALTHHSYLPYLPFLSSHLITLLCQFPPSTPSSPSL